jgi:hypothetical protein
MELVDLFETEPSGEDGAFDAVLQHEVVVDHVVDLGVLWHGQDEEIIHFQLSYDHFSQIGLYSPIRQLIRTLILLPRNMPQLKLLKIFSKLMNLFNNRHQPRMFYHKCFGESID